MGDCDPAGIVFDPCFDARFDAATRNLFQAAGRSRCEGVRIGLDAFSPEAWRAS